MELTRNGSNRRHKLQHVVPASDPQIFTTMLSNFKWGLPQGGKEEMEEVIVFGRPWQYRGEGNANIVIALQDDLRVIRFSKVGKGEEAGEWGAQRRKVEREVAFANNVFIPLLGVEYVGHVEAVHMAPNNIQLLNKLLVSLRPDYRLHKELKIPFATAHRDFARIHPYPSKRTDYCIEIKPKQGWWPKHLKNTNHCTYCLNQFQKLERSKISCRTDYCPLDLFSGVPERMIKAILSLIANPQNNLRIFRDGLLVYGENMTDSLDQILEEWIESEKDCDNKTDFNQESPSALSNFVFLMCLSLLKPKRSQPFPALKLNEGYENIRASLQSVLTTKGTGQGIDITEDCCYENYPKLPEGSILSMILEIQKLADVPGGVERIYDLYSRICPVHRGKLRKKSSSSSDEVFEELEPEPRKVPDSDDDEEERSESESGSSGRSSLSQDGEDDGEDTEEEVTIIEDPCPGPRCLSMEKWMDELGNNFEKALGGGTEEVENYLVAATAKDCSIMVTFSPVYGARARELSLEEAESDSLYTTLYSPTSPSISNYEESDLILQDLNKTFHRVRIGVADLDPKPVSCIVKHFLRDGDMLKDYDKAKERAQEESIQLNINLGAANN